MSTEYGAYSGQIPGLWADAYYSTDYPWSARDNSTSTRWRKGTLPQYLYVEFGNFKDYVIDRIDVYNTAANNTVKTFDLWGGTHNNDGTITWTAIASGLELSSSSSYGTVSFTNTTAYRYYQMKFTALRNATTYGQVYEIRFYGPDSQNPGTNLTKHTTGSETYTDSGHTTNHPFSLAFDGDDATYFANSGSNQWIKVDFGANNAKVCTKWVFYQNFTNNYYGPGAFTIHGSNDNSNWTQLHSGTNEQKSGHYHEFTWTNTTSYRYYRMTYTVSTSYWYIGTCDLYGTVPNPDPPDNSLSLTYCPATPSVPPDNMQSLTYCEDIIPAPADMRSLTYCEALPYPPADMQSLAYCPAILMPTPDDSLSLTFCPSPDPGAPQDALSLTFNPDIGLGYGVGTFLIF